MSDGAPRTAYGMGLSTQHLASGDILDVWFPEPRLGLGTGADGPAGLDALRRGGPRPGPRHHARAGRGRHRPRRRAREHPGHVAAAAPAVAPAGPAARAEPDGRLRAAHQRRVDQRRAVRRRGVRGDPDAAARRRAGDRCWASTSSPGWSTTCCPSGVRIADADRVRLGAHLASGTTVMHEGFVNYNAGTLGTSMVEGRISAGVVVGDGSDIGGGASIMGTLSGGGTGGHLGRRALPAGRERRHRHLARRRLRRRGRLLRHRRDEGHLAGRLGGQGPRPVRSRRPAVPAQQRHGRGRGGGAGRQLGLA